MGNCLSGALPIHLRSKSLPPASFARARLFQLTWGRTSRFCFWRDAPHFRKCGRVCFSWVTFFLHKQKKVTCRRQPRLGGKEQNANLHTPMVGTLRFAPPYVVAKFSRRLSANAQGQCAVSMDTRGYFRAPPADQPRWTQLGVRVVWGSLLGVGVALMPRLWLSQKEIKNRIPSLSASVA